MNAPIKALVNLLDAAGDFGPIGRCCGSSWPCTNCRDPVFYRKYKSQHIDINALDPLDPVHARCGNPRLGDNEEYEGEAKHRRMDDRGFNKR